MDPSFSYRPDLPSCNQRGIKAVNSDRINNQATYPKFLLSITLLEKFSSGNFITCIEVSHMTRQSSKTKKLRNVNTARGRTGNVPIKKDHLLCQKQRHYV